VPDHKIYKTSTGRIYLEPDTHKLTLYLKQTGWLSAEDSIASIQKPGEGNMNLVLRVVPVNANPFVIKQARPWVEKFPHLQAPVERIYVEHQYYRHVNRHLPLACFSPVILGFDQVNGVLAMEDLGDTLDFTSIYNKGPEFESLQLEKAIDYLNRLKSIPAPDDFPLNLELRKLNHQHIFTLPFQQNAFNLDKIQPGLQQLAVNCINDVQLLARIQKLGQTYLSAGNYLLHGDFYPGSLLESKDGDLKVIDPEFSFAGPEEWDIAVFTAHLHLSRIPADQVSSFFAQFEKSADFNHQYYLGFTGVEILRRLLGLAQVPVTLSLHEKSNLIDQAKSWIKAHQPGR
jgi:5-methylthioribose kinase